MGKEQPAEYYDQNFANKESDYKKHYTELECFPVWETMFRQIESLSGIYNSGLFRPLDSGEAVASPADIHLVDLGCGTGQFAQMAADLGFGSYVGIDFSEKAIAMADNVSLPESYSFVVGDLKPTFTRSGDNHGVVAEPEVVAEARKSAAALTVFVSSEFLEHVPWDVPLLLSLRPGSFVVGSVPNQDSAGHVRWFGSVSEVVKRYSRSLYILDARHCLPYAQEHYSFMGVVWPEQGGQGTFMGVPECPHVLDYNYGL